jgi:hypothetical protein
MIPDNETLRMMRDLRERMPDTATQRMIQEAIRATQDPIREAVIRQHLEFKNLYGDQLRAIAESVATSAILKAAGALQPHIEAITRSAYIETINAVRNSIPFETLNSVAQAMRELQTNAAWAAFETIKQMQYRAVVANFPDFEDVIISEAPSGEPKQVERAIKKYVAKQKKRGLTKEQYEALMAFLQVFSIIVTIYFGIQQGMPTNNIQVVYPPGIEQVAKPKWYVVKRACLLKVYPNFKSATIAVIPEQTTVEVVFVTHQWLYVEYQPHDEDIPKYGYVNKKYLKMVEK